jgi:hypothetical protein
MLLAEQIATYLDTCDLGTYSPSGSSGNIYIDMLPEGENKIAIYNKGGPSHDSKLGYKHPSIQIIYKGNRNPIEAAGIADSIFDALHGFHSDYFVNGQNYIVSCLSSQSQPEMIGANEQGYFEYSMTFIVEYKI